MVLKTTVELPKTTLQKAEIIAAQRGLTLIQFVTEALEEKLLRSSEQDSDQDVEPPWMAGFGELSDLSEENSRILGIIEEEFGIICSENNS